VLGPSVTLDNRDLRVLLGLTIGQGGSVLVTGGTLDTMGLTIGQGGSILVAGGVLDASTCDVQPGGQFQYDSGRVLLSSGLLRIGEGGMTGQNEATTVSLSRPMDEIHAGGSLAVDEGYSLWLAAGSITGGTVQVNGTFGFGGPGEEDPGQGRLTVWSGGGPGPSACDADNDFDNGDPTWPALRIGSGSGDAVINARSTVIVGGQGLLSAPNGLLQVDEGYTLRVLESAGEPNVQAWEMRVAGRLELAGGHVNTIQGLTVAPGGELQGKGTIDGSILNDGIVAPGESPGTLHVIGDYVQSEMGELRIEILSDTEYDQLLIDGLAQLAGTLVIDVAPGFTPQAIPLTILSASAIEGDFGQVVLDNPALMMRRVGGSYVVAPVPEPSAWALVAGGILGAVALWRRRARGAIGSKTAP